MDQLKKLQIDIEKKNEQLKILASNDPLTNCLNRRTFFSRLEEETSDPAAGQPTVSFLMVDGDHFKSINDRFGHAVGDRVLIGLVEIMHRLSSEGALVGRYGGEEFCLAVVGRPKAEAEDLAERIRSAVAVERTWLPEGQRVTVSIGVSFRADRSLPIADLVQRADEALYAAKLEGRNRVVSWERMRASPQMLAG
jgi:diguanylate cyclase (GGDEF)-like protein